MSYDSTVSIRRVTWCHMLPCVIITVLCNYVSTETIWPISLASWRIRRSLKDFYFLSWKISESIQKFLSPLAVCHHPFRLYSPLAACLSLFLSIFSCPQHQSSLTPPLCCLVVRHPSLPPSLLFHTLSSVTPVEAERSRESLIRTPASFDTCHAKVKEGDVKAKPSVLRRRARLVMNLSFSCSFYICSASSACLLTCLASSYFYKEASCERGWWSKWLKIAPVVLVKQGQLSRNDRGIHSLSWWWRVTLQILVQFHLQCLISGEFKYWIQHFMVSVGLNEYMCGCVL